MIANRSKSGWFTIALAAALFAVTLNFLQPLAHAVLLREGAPAALWTAFCNSMAAEPVGSSHTPPAAGQTHECCLGLAHAPALTERPQVSVAIEPTVRKVRFDAPVSVAASTSRHGRPSQPRAPPLNS